VWSIHLSNGVEDTDCQVGLENHDRKHTNTSGLKVWRGKHSAHYLPDSSFSLSPLELRQRRVTCKRSAEIVKVDHGDLAVFCMKLPLRDSGVCN
jgi:hypothetical protein